MNQNTTDLEVLELTVPMTLVVQLEVSVGNAPGEVGDAMGKAFTTLMDVIKRQELVTVGAPRAIYLEWGASGTRFAAAIPIAKEPPTIIDDAGVALVDIPEQQSLRFVHRGSYKAIAETYAKIELWLRERGGITSTVDWTRYSPMWEEYVTDPATTPESDLMTYIYLPLR